MPGIWKKIAKARRKNEKEMWEMKDKGLRNEEGEKTEDKDRRKDLPLWGMNQYMRKNVGLICLTNLWN